MISGFQLRRLRVIGKGKDPAEVSFDRGFNVMEVLVFRDLTDRYGSLATVQQAVPLRVFLASAGHFGRGER